MSDERVRLRPVDFDPFAPPPPPEVRLPLTEPQAEMWTAAAMGPEASCSYNQCFDLTLEGPLDVASLRAALEQVVARHEALRVTIAADGQSQAIRPPSGVELPLVDLAGAAPADADAQVEALLLRESETPFDLAQGPLLRATLVRESETRHHLVLTAHHIVCDGWASTILFADLERCYAADRVGLQPQLEPPASYRAYVEALSGGDGAAARRRDEEHWAERYAEGAPVLELPLDRPRAPRKAYRSGRAERRIDADLHTTIRSAGARKGATSFALLLAAYEVLLHQLSGQTDLVVGIPFAGQAALEDPALVAHCVSTVPLPARLDPAAPFSDLLRQVRLELADAQDHSGVTFGSLVRRLRIPRDPARTPLVPVTFTIDKLGAPPAFGEARVTRIRTPKAYSNFELQVTVVDSGRDAVVECDYSAALFDASTVEQWLAHYELLLREVAARPGIPIEELPRPRSAPARRPDVPAVGAIGAVEPLHRSFESQAARTPAREALIAGAERISYGELDARANRLARHLAAEGVAPGALVGACLPAGPELVVALLAAWKAGAAYVPLDPALPPKRLAAIAADVQPAAVVTTAALAGALGDLPATRIRLDADAARIAAAGEARPEVDGGPAELAYVVFTPGPDGRPAPVAVEHGGAAQRVRWATTVLGERERSGVLAASPPSSHLSILELLIALASGGRAVLAGDPADLQRLPARDEVTAILVAPAVVNELVRKRALPQSVEAVLLHGEAPAPRLVERLHGTGHVRRVLALHGPPEAGFFAAAADHAAGADPGIGRPVTGVEAAVLDAWGEPVAPGTAGELHLTGEGLAREYLGRPELTAERFVHGHDGARAFRTGDLVRERPDGTLELTGRADRQVMVRGTRIEPAEVEAVLARQEDVADAAVLAREDRPGDRRLVAYVVARSGRVPAGRLRAALAEELAADTIPAHIVPLPAIPRGPDGELDPRTLPAPGPEEITATSRYVAPRTPTETRIAAIWAEALDISPPGVDDDFFDLGGHSIKAAQVVAAVRGAFAVDVGLRHLFEEPTVGGLARTVDLLAVSGGASPAAGTDEREEIEL